ncbi:sodium- and chloride-dependent glycine transporter 2-like [Ylistrum balloti]|uniref:sodium- and chloride-dependent glycine transporter 2-like n=1 Tax=Ylistrum balloti TaxID=509963 RepID=UPI002905D504|nr:sodium- and chloride-dependent glycine transporter 2-like [Ylistrum balloti]
MDEDILFEEGTERKPEEKGKWSSKSEALIVLLGYSIGLPETWKLPFLVYRNGGGAFLIPYGLLILLCGYPLYFMELALSQFAGAGPWQIWNICPMIRGFGLSIAAINLLTVIFDNIVQCWAVEYLVNSFSTVLPWTTCDNSWNTPNCTIFINNSNYSANSSLSNFYGTVQSNETGVWSNETRHSGDGFTVDNPLVQVSAVEEFWKFKILRVSSGIEDIGDINGMYLLYIAIIKIIVCCAIVKSIKSLGKVMVVTAILPVFILIAILVRAITLPGSAAGMLYFIYPDFSKLLNVQIWVEAAFVAFNTLGPGWGGLMMIGCHNKFNYNCLRASLISSISVLLIGLFNGFVVFATAGVMAHEAEVPIESAITSGGFSIGFIAYPKALSYFPLPQAWCVLFYLVLILPGIDALTVMMEPFLLVLEEMCPSYLQNRRVALLTVTSIATFVIGILFVTQAGVYIFILGIWYIATWNIVVICMVEAVVFGWVYGCNRLDKDVQIMLGRPMPGPVRISLAFIIPIFLSVLLVISVATYRTPTFGSYEYPGYAAVIGWILTLSTLAPGVVYAIYTISTQKGNLHQKCRKSLRPNNAWYPVEPKYREIWKRENYDNQLTWKQLFLYNLLGEMRHSDSTQVAKDEQYSLKSLT